MIETAFAEYGIVGAFLGSQFLLIKWFMKKDDIKDKNLIGIIAENTQVIKNNTQALTIVSERMR